MKIFDCFMFYDEEMILDFRLNYLNDFVDKFIVVESSFTHSGKKRDLLFNEKNFSKFKDKISYIALNEEPPDLFDINEEDYCVYCDQNILHDLNEKIVLKFGQTTSTELIWKSENNISIEKENAEKLFKLLRFETLKRNIDKKNTKKRRKLFPKIYCET